MRELVTVNEDAIRAAVVPVLVRFPQVAGAYLFGSSLGRCRPDSDIDIGLVPTEGAAATEGERESMETSIVS
ncbi:MAG: hypothetical protein AB1700_06525 [Bacillota bacterium]